MTNAKFKTSFPPSFKPLKEIIQYLICKEIKIKVILFVLMFCCFLWGEVLEI